MAKFMTKTVFTVSLLVMLMAVPVFGMSTNKSIKIELSGVQIGGDVSTVSGDIYVVEGSVIKGDLKVDKPGGWSWGTSFKGEPMVVIGPGSSVVGNVELEHKVKLFISVSAQVGGVTGVMTLDDAVRFSGKQP